MKTPLVAAKNDLDYFFPIILDKIRSFWFFIRVEFTLKYFMLSLFMITSCLVFAQENKEVERLKSFLDDQSIINFADKDPERILYFAFVNLHGYSIASAGDKDLSYLPDADEISSFYGAVPKISDAVQQGNFNLLAYPFAIEADKNLTYRIGNSDLVLTVYSTKKNDILYNESKSK